MQQRLLEDLDFQTTYFNEVKILTFLGLEDIWCAKYLKKETLKKASIIFLKKKVSDFRVPKLSKRSKPFRTNNPKKILVRIPEPKFSNSSDTHNFGPNRAFSFWVIDYGYF